MKKLNLKTLIAALLAAILSLVSLTSLAESDPAALAKELLTRHVTEEDVVTVEVIEAVIRELKENTEFEAFPELKIGSGDWAYLAEKRGWFEQLFGDTKVTLVEGTVGNEVQLFERGELDFTGRMLYPYLLYKAQGADIIAIALTQDPDPEIVGIFVNSASDLQSLDDLKGKKVASWKAGCQYIALREQLQDRGWTEDVDYTYVNVSNDNIKTALQAGEVDAISVHPFADYQPLVDSGIFRQIGTAKPNGVYTNYGGASVTFTSKKAANEKTNLLKGVIKLRELVNAYLIQNQEEGAKLVEEITRTPAAGTLFNWERSKKTYYLNGDKLDKIIDDTVNYQQWLIDNIEDFTEENRSDRNDLFDARFFE